MGAGKTTQYSQEAVIHLASGVGPDKRWGYMLTPHGSAGKGSEQARADEKVVIYFHGG